MSLWGKCEMTLACKCFNTGTENNRGTERNKSNELVLINEVSKVNTVDLVDLNFPTSGAKLMINLLMF